MLEVKLFAPRLRFIIMRIVVLTGDQPRHIFFANSLVREAGSVAAIFSEGKAFNPAAGEPAREKNRANLPREEAALWEWHLSLGRKEEERFFGTHRQFVVSSQSFYPVPKGEINNPEWVLEIAHKKPDAIAVYGTSLLRGPIIALAPGRIINMHLGLSPYYRGSGTNLWPLANGEPEYVGATIHLIDQGIDTGAVIHQGRPDIEIGDNHHGIGNKTIVAGTRLMVRAIQECAAGTLRPIPQTGRGKLYQRKDFTADTIRRIKSQFENGLIERYCGRKHEAMSRVPIVS